MFKPHIGDCIQCDRKKVIIPVRSGLCQYCNHERKQRNKSSTKIEHKECKDHFKNSNIERDNDILFNVGSERGALDSRKKTNQKIQKRPIQHRRKPTGEKEIFEEIAEEREWTCFVSNKNLMELTPTQFMHVLPKALNKYPLFKLYKPNIQLASNEIHHLWDHTPRSELKKDKRFDKLFDLEAQLKEEYKQLKP